MNLGTPFPPLNTDTITAEPAHGGLMRLADQMADFYQVDPQRLLVVRGAAHGLELMLRSLTREDGQWISAEDGQYEDICRAYKIRLKPVSATETVATGGQIHLINNPRTSDGRAWTVEEIRTLAANLFPAMLVVDESYIDIVSSQSVTGLTAILSNVVVLRNMAYLAGEADCQVGALISNRHTIRILSGYCELSPLPSASLRQALHWLAPVNRPELDSRREMIRTEQARIRDILTTASRHIRFDLNDGPFLVLHPTAMLQVQLGLNDLNIKSYLTSRDLLVPLGMPETNNLILKALGVNPADPARLRLRSLKPARKKRPIRCQAVECGHGMRVKLDFDSVSPIEVRTGNGFFDHMLEKMASHGEFSLQVIPDGSRDDDAGKSLVDTFSVIAKALTRLIIDNTGLACASYVTQETGYAVQIRIELDRGAFCRFDMAFDRLLIGAFPTRATAECIELLSKLLCAEISVQGSGMDDFEKTSGCFKALGAALRQVVESGATGRPLQDPTNAKARTAS